MPGAIGGRDSDADRVLGPGAEAGAGRRVLLMKRHLARHRERLHDHTRTLAVATGDLEWRVEYERAAREARRVQQVEDADIGRAGCSEREGQYVYVAEISGSLQK